MNTKLNALISSLTSYESPGTLEFELSKSLIILLSESDKRNTVITKTMIKRLVKRNLELDCFQSIREKGFSVDCLESTIIEKALQSLANIGIIDKRFYVLDEFDTEAQLNFKNEDRPMIEKKLIEEPNGTTIKHPELSRFLVRHELFLEYTVVF